MTSEDQSLRNKIRINPIFKVYLRSPKGKVPTKGSALAAGYDLYSAEAATIPAHGQD